MSENVQIAVKKPNHDEVLAILKKYSPQMAKLIEDDDYSYEDLSDIQRAKYQAAEIVLRLGKETDTKQGFDAARRELEAPVIEKAHQAIMSMYTDRVTRGHQEDINLNKIAVQRTLRLMDDLDQDIIDDLRKDEASFNQFMYNMHQATAKKGWSRSKLERMARVQLGDDVAILEMNAEVRAMHIKDSDVEALMAPLRAKMMWASQFSDDALQVNDAMLKNTAQYIMTFLPEMADRIKKKASYEINDDMTLDNLSVVDQMILDVADIANDKKATAQERAEMAMEIQSELDANKPLILEQSQRVEATPPVVLQEPKGENVVSFPVAKASLPQAARASTSHQPMSWVRRAANFAAALVVGLGVATVPFGGGSDNTLNASSMVAIPNLKPVVDNFEKPKGQPLEIMVASAQQSPSLESLLPAPRVVSNGIHTPPKPRLRDDSDNITPVSFSVPQDATIARESVSHLPSVEAPKPLETDYCPIEDEIIQDTITLRRFSGQAVSLKSVRRSREMNGQPFDCKTPAERAADVFGVSLEAVEATMEANGVTEADVTAKTPKTDEETQALNQSTPSAAGSFAKAIQNMKDMGARMMRATLDTMKANEVQPQADDGGVMAQTADATPEIMSTKGAPVSSAIDMGNQFVSQMTAHYGDHSMPTDVQSLLTKINAGITMNDADVITWGAQEAVVVMMEGEGATSFAKDMMSLVASSNDGAGAMQAKKDMSVWAGVKRAFKLG